MTNGKRQAGFTLIEALVASAVFGLIMVGVFTVYATNSSAFNRGRSRAEVHQNGRVALDRMVRELRVAGYDMSGTIDGMTSPTSIQVAQADRVTFVADLDLDGTLDQATFLLSSGRLLRQVAAWGGSAFGSASSSVLADELGTLTFSYFDENDTAITAPVASTSLDGIARITVALETNATTVGKQESFPLVGDVRLRN